MKGNILTPENIKKIEKIYQNLPSEKIKNRFLKDLNYELEFFLSAYLDQNDEVNYRPITILPTKYERKVHQVEGHMEPLKPRHGTYVSETKMYGTQYVRCITEEGNVIKVPKSYVQDEEEIWDFKTF